MFVVENREKESDVLPLDEKLPSILADIKSPANIITIAKVMAVESGHEDDKDCSMNLMVNQKSNGSAVMDSPEPETKAKEDDPAPAKIRNMVMTAFSIDKVD